MKKSDTHAFVNQLLVCLLVTFGVGGSIGVGTVWMRHQISVAAKKNLTLNAEINELDRKLAGLNSLIESEQSPEILRRQNADWRLGLMLVHEAQTKHVSDDPVRALAVRNNRETFAPEFDNRVRLASGP